MASVRLNGDTSGFIEISAPSVAGSTTITLPATSGGDFLVTDSNGDLNVDSGTLFVDASENRVGIGTTSPSRNLVVNSGASDGIFQLTNNTSGTGAAEGFELIHYTTGETQLINRENAAMAFYTNNIQRLRIESNGALNFIGSGTPGTSQTVSFNASAPTNSIVLDSSGRLLVGTSTARSPVSATPLIQVEGTTYAKSSISITQNSNDSNSANFYLAKSRGGSLGSHAVISVNDEIGSIDFLGADGSQMVRAARIQCVSDATPGANDMPGRLVFSTTADGASSPTERLRINRAGTLEIRNSSFLTPQTDNVVALGGGTDQRWTAVYAANGTIQTSDARTKTNIETATLGSNFIKSLRPVSYTWIEGGKRDTGERDEDGNYIYESVPGKRTHWGFIAQEVKDAVDTAGVDFGGWLLANKDDPDSQQALRYDQFIAPLTKALQEALAKIETLETANASLEARLTALEGGN